MTYERFKSASTILFHNLANPVCFVKNFHENSSLPGHGAYSMHKITFSTITSRTKGVPLSSQYAHQRTATIALKNKFWTCYCQTVRICNHKDISLLNDKRLREATLMHLFWMGDICPRNESAASLLQKNSILYCEVDCFFKNVEMASFIRSQQD